jgi:ribose-phosphate pyrophosphokinase
MHYVGGIEGIRLIAGSASEGLADEISANLGVPLTKRTIRKFPDNETYFRVEENVRGKDVFIIQSTSEPANENLMELLIMIDALKRTSAGRITAVIPYFGYCRQDRKASSREPITAKLVANLLTIAGADRILTLDLHADQIQGFFDIPLDDLTAWGVIMEHFRKMDLSNFIVVAPDEGAAKSSAKFAEKLGIPIVLMSKRRSLTQCDTIERTYLLGDVNGKDVIMIDDQIMTGGTLIGSINVLKLNGAKDIYPACTHPILVHPSEERFNNAPIKELVVTNTIPLKGKSIKNMKVLSIAPLLSEAIRRIHTGESVSSLFD